MDTQISPMPKEARDSGPWAIWKVFTHHEEVAQPSLVLLRIRNSGLRSIGQADMRRPLTFTFPGRVVKEFTVTDCRGVSRQQIQPPADLSSPPVVENRISLPRFPMKRRAGFKLLVLLSGEGQGIVVKGHLRRGSVVHATRVRGPLAMNIAFGAVLLLLVGIQSGITFSQTPTLPSFCGSGQLTMEGSTAFAPAAQAIGEAYTAVCHSAAISVSAIATFNGLNEVAAANGGGLSKAVAKATMPVTSTQIAMSDGPAPVGYPTLVGHRVAVIVFTVVVNTRDNIFNLTTAQLRDIFLGKITNWKQINGVDLPISIVARTTASGTRRAFDEKVLGGLAEPPFSSYNCTSKNAVTNAPFTRCEVTDTSTLLEKVNTIPGAIGYAQYSDAGPYPNVTRISINGADSSVGDVEGHTYPFWTVEYLYTSGPPPAGGSLPSDFLGYMNNTTSSDILRAENYIPCVDRGQVNPLCR